jgi:uncharacterized membrane protein
MRGLSSRWPAIVALVASLLGLVFAGSSTFDYAQHLDRQVHGVHCSFVPGLGAAEAGESACKTALFSPYSAILRDALWGGVPISLFAMGAFSFFCAFSIYLLFAGSSAPRRAFSFLAFASVFPVLASAVMAFLSVTRLGELCKTCVGIYTSSALLAIAACVALVKVRREARLTPADAPSSGPAGVPATLVDDALAAPTPRREGGVLLFPAWLAALGLFAALPALLYASAVPSFTSYIGGCGKLLQPNDTTKALLHVTSLGAVQPALLVVDPLCPTCKGFHQRLEGEGVLEKLDLSLLIFPLDSECNWMLDRAVHPGACVVSKAMLCGGDDRAMSILEWAYQNQEEIRSAAKGDDGAKAVKALVARRFSGLDACIDAKDTGRRLDRMLRYAVENQLPVSTPQLFVGERRLCEEDTDIGFAFAIRRLAPGLFQK